MERLNSILERVREYLPDFKEELFVEAYNFAKNAHQGQLRRSGEPYISHPLETVRTLVSLQVDQNTLIAALLHDVPEDTNHTLEEIKERFGPEVAFLVNGVTKLSKVHYRNRMEERQVASLRKMFLVMAKDVRVILIKLADRLHNMRTLHYVRADKQERIARETLEVYAPLANLLGVWQLRWALEDYCLQYLNPLAYTKLKDYLAQTNVERSTYINKLKELLEDTLRQAKIEAQVQGRTKHLYSIYHKMQRERKEVTEIFDIFGLRIIVDTIEDCYRVLGLVHKLWHPKAGRFKDYIALPKPNGYQSLHTTVFGPEGQTTEFQIRTREMHHEAERGIAAHLLYQNQQGRFPIENVPWVKNILELHGQAPDNGEFMEDLKLDVFQDRIFVFTPKGDVVDLPIGATALDLAYNVHTSLGHRARRVRVNDNFVPLNYKLQLGDTVEVLGDNLAIGPKREWLEFVITSQAKKAIKTWFSNEPAERKLAIGKEILQKELQRLQGPGKQELSKRKQKMLSASLGYENFVELLKALGEGSLTTERLLTLLHNVKHSRGQTFWSILEFLVRKFSFKSDNSVKLPRKVWMKIITRERIGLTRDIASTVSSMGIDIDSMYVRKGFFNKERGVVKLSLRFKDYIQFRQLCNNLEAFDDIYFVARVVPAWSFAIFFWMIVTVAVWLSHPLLIQYLLSLGLNNNFAYYLLLCVGFCLLFVVIVLLKILARRSFPSLYREKPFWILALFINVLATITVLWEIQMNQLHLNWVVVTALFAVLYLYLALEYSEYRKLQD